MSRTTYYTAAPIPEQRPPATVKFSGRLRAAVTEKQICEGTGIHLRLDTQQRAACRLAAVAGKIGSRSNSSKAGRGRAINSLTQREDMTRL